MGLDGFSMHPLAAELRAKLAGGRVDRVFQPNKHTVLLAVRQPGRNYTLHISINPQNPVINIIDHALDNPPAPPLFCMVLRKQIEDGRIATIEQSALDRVILVHIDALGAGGILLTKTLIVELMGKHSNIILVQDNKIIDAMRKVGSNENRLRQILPGRMYVAPPNQIKCNLLAASTADLTGQLKEYSGMRLTKALIQACLGLGPVSAREFVWRAGLPEDILIDDMEGGNYQSLSASIAEIVADIKNSCIFPTVVTDPNKKPLAIAAFKLKHLKGNIVHTFATMSEALDFTTAAAGSYAPPDKERFKKLIRSETAKAQNKLAVLQEELQEAHQAEEYKRKADILMTYQHLISGPYAKEASLPDIYAPCPEKEPVRITLDPLLTPAQNMQKYYQKYNKLKRAQELLLVQISQCQADIGYLATIDNSLNHVNGLAEITEIKNELISSGYLKEMSKRKILEKPSKPLKFLFEDTVILVGKNNYQNDALTFKTSQPSDLWLHAKDIPGSHVIVRLEKSEPSETLIAYAAKLAAYFSQAKEASNIPVDYTKRQYVKKPSGAKPGFVNYTNQKTIYVTPPNDEEMENGMTDEKKRLANL